MPFFNVSGYIVSATDKHIYLRVNEDNKEKINTIMNNLSKTEKNIDIMKIQISKCKIFVSSINWTNITDLVGISVIINCKTKYYCFKQEGSDNTYTIRKGYTIVANTIKNIN